MIEQGVVFHPNLALLKYKNKYAGDDSFESEQHLIETNMIYRDTFPIIE